MNLWICTAEYWTLYHFYWAKLQVNQFGILQFTCLCNNQYTLYSSLLQLLSTCPSSFQWTGLSVVEQLLFLVFQPIIHHAVIMVAACIRSNTLISVYEVTLWLAGGPASIWMGDCLQADKSSWRVTQVNWACIVSSLQATGEDLIRLIWTVVSLPVWTMDGRVMWCFIITISSVIVKHCWLKSGLSH